VEPSTAGERERERERKGERERVRERRKNRFLAFWSTKEISFGIAQARERKSSSRRKADAAKCYLLPRQG
jgi:hypothetical protein